MEPTCCYEFVVNDERAFISESGSKIILGRSSSLTFRFDVHYSGIVCLWKMFFVHYSG